MLAIIEQWALVEYSFHAVLHVDLEDVWERKSWRWFLTRINGLMQAGDNPLARFFAPDDQPTPEADHE